MFAYFLMGVAAASQVPGANPAREASIINSMDLRDAKLSVNPLPLEFPDGTATMALDVNAKGKVTGCRMTEWEKGGAPDLKLEDVICSGLRRHARFDPALDAAGQPIDSVLTIGVDPALPEEPRLGDISSLFSSDDYPNAALRNGAQGTVTVRLTVDAKGKPTDCKVIGSSGSPPLDARTCEIYASRARFEPGKDSTGNPLGGTSIERVRWQLPDHRPFSDMMLRNSMTFDADGNVKDCDSFWGDSSMKKSACDQLKSIALKALSPIQRAFRTLIQEQGFAVGPKGVIDQIGTHKGENRLMMVAAFVTVDDAGRVTGCEPFDAKSKEAVGMLCKDARQTKFIAAKDGADASQRTAVSYSALILRRPGF